jgi:hypothetical protein
VRLHQGAGHRPLDAGNYLSHLASIFTIARPMWKYPLDRQAMDDAQVVLRKMGIIAKSDERDRARPWPSSTS